MTKEKEQIAFLKELLNYRKQKKKWSEICKIVGKRYCTLLHIFILYKKKYSTKLKKEDYTAKITCRQCGKTFNINLLSSTKSFTYCSEQCERKYFRIKCNHNRGIVEQHLKEMERDYKTIKNLRAKKYNWKDIEIIFGQKPDDRIMEKRFSRWKKKFEKAPDN